MNVKRATIFGFLISHRDWDENFPFSVRSTRNEEGTRVGKVNTDQGFLRFVKFGVGNHRILSRGPCLGNDLVYQIGADFLLALTFQLQTDSFASMRSELPHLMHILQ